MKRLLLILILIGFTGFVTWRNYSAKPIPVTSQLAPAEPDREALVVNSGTTSEAPLAVETPAPKVIEQVSGVSDSVDEPNLSIANNVEFTKQILDREWSGPTEIDETTLRITNENPDGSFQAEFISADGARGYHWYDTAGNLAIEELQYDDGMKVSKWFELGDERENIIQVERGDVGGQSVYHPNFQKKYSRYWRGQEPETRVEY